MAGYCHSWAPCPILGTFMILYVPLIYLKLSRVGFEKTWAVKDWTQLGREDLLEGHPGQRCKAQITQEQRITPHEWSKLFSNCLAVSCKKHKCLQHFYQHKVITSLVDTSTPCALDQRSQSHH